MEQPDALTLTGIGIGTSFTVLVLLLVSVLLIRLVARILNDDEDEATAHEEAPAAPIDDIEDQEARNRATAAAIAVTALLESRPYLRSRPHQERNE